MKPISGVLTVRLENYKILFFIPSSKVQNFWIEILHSCNFFSPKIVDF